METVAKTHPVAVNDSPRIANVSLPLEKQITKIGPLALSNFDVAAGVVTVLMIWGPMLAGAIHGH
jgi:hypothetical protein